MGLEEYLTYCVENLDKVKDFKAVHIVLGNETCDLDSAVSTTTYAYYLHEANSLPVGTAIFIPVLNIPRSQFRLRTEVTFLFSKYNIKEQHLVFLDDLDLQEVKARTDLKVTLVDHHVLSAGTRFLDDCVVQVIDHRPRSGSLPEGCEITIETVGSCSTLVAEALLGDEAFVLDPVIATLLWGAVVTDTINFSPAAGKTTQKDLDIAKQLEEVIGQGFDMDSRESLYQDIKQAKFDLSGLSNTELLEKDLKIVAGDSLKVAMSSIAMPLSDLLRREDLLDSLKDFLVKCAAEAVLVMTVDVGDDGSIARELAIFSPSRVYRQQMADVLIACQSPSLGLTPMVCRFEELLPFHQANVTASRKQVLPIVQGFLAGETTPDESHLDTNLHCSESEGFTSLTIVGGGRQDTTEGEITSEELVSQNLSSQEEDSSPAMEDTNLLSLPGYAGKPKRVFDPLSSVHSSDGVPSPTEFASKDEEGGPSNTDSVFEQSVSMEDQDAMTAYDEHDGSDFFSRKIEEDAEAGEILTLTASPNNKRSELFLSSDSVSSAATSSKIMLTVKEEEKAKEQLEMADDAGKDGKFTDRDWDLPQSENKIRDGEGEEEATTAGGERERMEGFSNLAYESSPNESPTDGNALAGGGDVIGSPLPAHTQVAAQGTAEIGSSFNHPRESAAPVSVDDILEMTSPHDLLFSAVDSPHDLSAAPSGPGSGQTSGQTSLAPSYPVTPPNSYMDGVLQEKQVHLPSFNSSEMVVKMQEKRASLPKFILDGDTDLDADPEPSNSSHILSPFTPHNSYVDSTLKEAASEAGLPSFHGADMVQKIQEKRTSMEREILVLGSGAVGEQEEALGALLEVAAAPLTPHNSFAERSRMEAYAGQHHLPSLNSAEMAHRIRQRQAELDAAVGETSEGSDGLLASDNQPYTPQNSYRDMALTTLASDAHRLDLSEVAERLSLSSSESSGSLSEPKAIKASNKLHASSSSSSIAGSDAIRFQLWEREDGTSSLGDDEEEREGEDKREEEGSLDARSAAAPMGLKRKGVAFAEEPSAPSPPVAYPYAGRGSSEEDMTGDEMSEEAVEEAIQRVAYQLANEMIQKALETFPAPSVKNLVESEVEESNITRSKSDSLEASRSSAEARRLGAREDSSPTMDESDRDMSSSGLLRFSSDITPESSPDLEDVSLGLSMTSPGDMKASTSLAEELAAAVQQPTNQETTRGYDIETEYLSDMDPMQLVHSPEATNIIETDADKEVVESSSFRKISGQELQTVQEEIMEEIRQEARQRKMSKARPPSVAEESEDGRSSAAVTSAEDKAAGGQEQDPALETKKRISPAVFSTVDEDRPERDAEGRRTVPAARDRELYASALDNNGEEEDVEIRPASAQMAGASPQQAPSSDFATSGPSGTAVSHLPQDLTSLPPPPHPLQEFSDEQAASAAARKIIPAESLEVTSPTEHHSYESLHDIVGAANTVPDNEEVPRQRGREEDGQRSKAAKVGRSISAASDTSAGRGRGLSGTELHDEWQDDELPHPLAEEGQLPTLPSSDSRKRLVPEGVCVGDDPSVFVVESDSDIDSDMDNEQLEWENDTPVRPLGQSTVLSEEIPPYTAADEYRDAHLWKAIDIGDGQTFRLDLHVIEPFKKVLSHGGYYGDGLNAMIVFSGCYLPSRDRVDYSYVMDHLFHYVIHTLEELVAENYMVVYFHGATPRRQMPSLGWLRRCYQGIDRRLKKNLKALYLVHPTLWLKTVVLMTRPFISTKFSSKLQFVRTLEDLKRLVPMDYIYIPEMVQRLDEKLCGHPQDPSDLHGLDNPGDSFDPGDPSMAGGGSGGAEPKGDKATGRELTDRTPL